jgi:hypothetical protein
MAALGLAVQHLLPGQELFDLLATAGTDRVKIAWRQEAGLAVAPGTPRLAAGYRGLVWRFPAEAGPDGPPELAVALAATAADPLAFEAASEAAADLLRQGLVPPAPLARFVADTLDGKRKRPRRRGPRAGVLWTRDATVRWVLRRLVGLGFQATRNEASDHADSACDIVAEACAMRGEEPRSYEAVRRIWLGRRNVVGS